MQDWKNKAVQRHQRDPDGNAYPAGVAAWRHSSGSERNLVGPDSVQRMQRHCLLLYLPPGMRPVGTNAERKIVLQRQQKIQGAGRILGSLFQQGDQSPHGFLRFLLRGGHQGIVQLYGKNNQDNLGKGLRIVEMDLPVLNPWVIILARTGLSSAIRWEIYF